MPKILARPVFAGQRQIDPADPYARVQEQQLIAEALRQRANQPLDQHYESTEQNFARGLTQLGHALIARQASKKADKASADADVTARAGVKTGIEQLIPQQAVQGQIDSVDGEPATPLLPGHQQQMAQTLAQRGQMQAATDNLPARNAQQVVAQALLQKAMPPDAMAVAQLQLQRDTLEGNRADREATRLQRMQELQMRLADGRTRAEEAAALRRELAQLQAETARQGQANQRATADAEAARKAAADKAVADAKTTKVETGKSGVSSITASLRDMYGQLKDSGGITSTETPGVGNVAAGVASSGVGQAAGRLFGTENQSNRNTIKQQRPLLLQAIKEATGMSAQQMNSNVELKLFLEAATDPSLDVQANMRALDKIDELYGDGPSAAAAPSAPAAGGFDEAAYNALPSGATYTAPDGSQRKKK